MNPKLKITVKRNGAAAVEVLNVQGTGCKSLTKGLEAVLTNNGKAGAVESTDKPELYMHGEAGETIQLF